jgi:hypothetical protein
VPGGVDLGPHDASPLVAWTLARFLPRTPKSYFT